jgi:uroporphyrinogen decarboxylase
MTARENALRIIGFDHPERVVSGPPTYGIAYRGANHEGYAGGGHDCPVGSVWTDIWGTVWHKEHADVMGFPRGNPLPDATALRAYRWPDPDDERICGPLHEAAGRFPGGDLFLSGSHRDTLWEKAYMLVGMERMMVAFHAEPGFAREVLRRIMDFQLGIARHYLAVGVEMVGMSDDLGSQRGPLLSPATVAEFLAPEYRRLFDLYRQHGVIVNFHSCGKVEACLDLFLDLGVHILNPVQASANDLEFVRRKTHGRMALQGAVGTRTLMDGPPAAITTEVRDRIALLGRDGGYFCAPDQGMPFPPAHIAAFDKALEQYGRYER